MSATGTAPELSPEEALRARVFGLDIPEGMEPVAAWKARTVALLSVQERSSRDRVSQLRGAYDTGVPLAKTAVLVQIEEARAGAFALALDIVEGMAL